jgi:hypothetical protein
VEDLRLTTARLRLRRRRYTYTGTFVRLLAFWITPALVVLTLAYIFAGRS